VQVPKPHFAPSAARSDVKEHLPTLRRETPNDASNYARVFMSDGAPARYEEQYRAGTFDAHMHQLQSVWLRQLCQRHFDEPPVHIDYACGTGRIVQALQAETQRAIGYDVSDAMLNRARRRCPDAEFIRVANDAPPDPPLVGCAVIATMYRLILDADQPTRDTGCSFLAEVLRRNPGSIAIVNNHGNTRSLRHFARYKGRQGRWVSELSDAEARRLFARHGLEVVDWFGIGHLPQSLYGSAIGRGARWLNSYLARRQLLTSVAIDISYVLAIEHADS